MRKKLDGYVKLREAAKMLGVSPNTLRNWGRSGKLKATRHPVKKKSLNSCSANCWTSARRQMDIAASSGFIRANPKTSFTNASSRYG